eukprot:9484343-Pyramimonas_sp.AAC.1
MSKEDKDNLKNFTHASAPSSSNAFLTASAFKAPENLEDRGDLNSKLKADDGATVPGKGTAKQKYVDMATAVPKLKDKISLKIQKAKDHFITLSATMNSAIQEAARLESEDQTLANYLHTVKVRKEAMILWRCDEAVSGQLVSVEMPDVKMNADSEDSLGILLLRKAMAHGLAKKGDPSAKQDMGKSSDKASDSKIAVPQGDATTPQKPSESEAAADSQGAESLPGAAAVATPLSSPVVRSSVSDRSASGRT